jgi:hypothetical protein
VKEGVCCASGTCAGGGSSAKLPSPHFSLRGPGCCCCCCSRLSPHPHAHLWTTPHSVLYVDIDIHHGDGVEEAFYLTDRVMTVSG